MKTIGLCGATYEVWLKSCVILKWKLDSLPNNIENRFYLMDES